METIFQSIEHALSCRSYYVAIVMALVLIDICAALESADGETSRDKYKAWYRTNLAAKYPRITDVDCYKLRCGVVHQGRCGHPDMQYARIIFTVPGLSVVSVHNQLTDDALTLDAGRFCQDVIASVRDWLAAKHGDATVQANLPNLMQYRMEGIPPYFVGIAVIA